MRMTLYLALGVVLLGALIIFLMVPRLLDQRFNRVATPPPYEVPAAALAVHDRLAVVDLHADFLLWRREALTRYDYGHVDVPRLLEGNVAIQVFAAVTKSPRGLNYTENTGDSDQITALAVVQRWPPRTWTSLTERALYQAKRLHDAAERSNGRLRVLRSVTDLDAYLDDRQQNQQQTAGLLAIEGLHAMEGSMQNLQALYDAGYRMMAITHFFDTELGGSAHGVERGGLTDLGREVIRWQEANGVIIDLAHVSQAVFDDILKMATKPVVVSHGGVQGTCPGPRNLTDAQIDRIAATDGLIGIGYWPGAVCKGGVDAIVQAMRYVADRVGTRHLALGSDFDGTVFTPFDTSGLPLLTNALIQAGFSEDEIAQIMGGNAIRVFRATLPAE